MIKSVIGSVGSECQTDANKFTEQLKDGGDQVVVKSLTLTTSSRRELKEIEGRVDGKYGRDDTMRTREDLVKVYDSKRVREGLQYEREYIKKSRLASDKSKGHEERYERCRSWQREGGHEVRDFRPKTGFGRPDTREGRTGSRDSWAVSRRSRSGPQEAQEGRAFAFAGQNRHSKVGARESGPDGRDTYFRETTGAFRVSGVGPRDSSIKTREQKNDIKDVKSDVQDGRFEVQEGQMHPSKNHSNLKGTLKDTSKDMRDERASSGDRKVEVKESRFEQRDMRVENILIKADSRDSREMFLESRGSLQDSEDVIVSQNHREEVNTLQQGRLSTMNAAVCHEFKGNKSISPRLPLQQADQEHEHIWKYTGDMKSLQGGQDNFAAEEVGRGNLDSSRNVGLATGLKDSQDSKLEDVQGLDNCRGQVDDVFSEGCRSAFLSRGHHIQENAMMRVHSYICGSQKEESQHFLKIGYGSEEADMLPVIENYLYEVGITHNILKVGSPVPVRTSEKQKQGLSKSPIGLGPGVGLPEILRQGVDELTGCDPMDMSIDGNTSKVLKRDLNITEHFLANCKLDGGENVLRSSQCDGESFTSTFNLSRKDLGLSDWKDLSDIKDLKCSNHSKESPRCLSEYNKIGKEEGCKTGGNMCKTNSKARDAEGVQKSLKSEVRGNLERMDTQHEAKNSPKKFQKASKSWHGGLSGKEEFEKDEHASGEKPAIRRKADKVEIEKEWIRGSKSGDLVDRDHCSKRTRREHSDEKGEWSAQNGFSSGKAREGGREVRRGDTTGKLDNAREGGTVKKAELLNAKAGRRFNTVKGERVVEKGVSFSGWKSSNKGDHSEASRTTFPKRRKDAHEHWSPSPSVIVHKRRSPSHQQESSRSSLPRFDRCEEREDWDTTGRERDPKPDFYDSRYRRFGGGTSGLGGYSPRRRRSDAAIKTPSPPSRSPERRKSRAWDLTPTGINSDVVAAIAAAHAAHQTATQQASPLTSVAPLVSVNILNSVPATAGYPTSAPLPGVPSSMIPSIMQQVNPALSAVTLTQATRPLRRLYVGNVPSTVSDGELLEFMNAAMLSANANHLPGTKPCINCSVNVEKAYAFAEFITPEDATAALAFDGVTLHGTTLKIRRPKDFVSPSNGGTEIAEPNFAMVSNVVVDTPRKSLYHLVPPTIVGVTGEPVVQNEWVPKGFQGGGKTMDNQVAAVKAVRECTSPKGGGSASGSKSHSIMPLVFVGGISSSLTSEKVKEIVTAFGQLKAYHWEVEVLLQRQACRTFAFLEYMDSMVTLRACAGLNGMRLGNSILTVVQATPDVSFEPSSANKPFYGVPEEAKTLLEPPTRILELCNMVTEEEVLAMSELELQEVMEDVRLECLRFGSVRSMHIVRAATADQETAVPSGSSLAAHLLVNGEGAEEVVDSSGLVPDTKTDVDKDAKPAKEVAEGVSLEDIVSLSCDKTTLDGGRSDCSNALDVEGDGGGRKAFVQAGSGVSFIDSRKVALFEGAERASQDTIEDTCERQAERVPNVVPFLTSEPTSDSTLLEGDRCGSRNSWKEVGRPGVTEFENLHNGRLYVEFSREETACQAAHALHGRKFANHKVMVCYFPVRLYQKKFRKGLGARTYEEKQALALAVQGHLTAHIKE